MQRGQSGARRIRLQRWASPAPPCSSAWACGLVNSLSELGSLWIPSLGTQLHRWLIRGLEREAKL